MAARHGGSAIYGQPNCKCETQLQSAQYCQSFAMLRGFFVLLSFVLFCLFVSLKAQPIAMHFMLSFQYDSYLTHDVVGCNGVSVALVKPERDRPVEAEEECETAGNKNSLVYILHVN